MNVRSTVLEKRWSRVWEAMRAAGLTSLIVAGRGTIGEYGWLHYVTGIFATTRVWYAIVHLDSPPQLVLRSVAEARALEKEAWVVMPSHIFCRSGLDYAAEVGGMVRLRGYGRIGIVGGESVGRSSWCQLAAALGGDPENVEELLRPVRAVNSEDDFDELKRAAAIAESGLCYALERVRAGMSERSLASEIETEVRQAGAQLTIIHVCRGLFSASRPTTDRIATDDVISILVELSSDTGYWVELGIAVAMPNASRGVPVASRCVSALAHGETALRSGGSVGSVAESMLSALGTDITPAIGLGHGVGIDEALPIVAAGSSERIPRSAAFALHPSGNDGKAQAGCAVANTFLVSGSEVEAVSHLPGKLHFIDSRSYCPSTRNT